MESLKANWSLVSVSYCSTMSCALIFGWSDRIDCNQLCVRMEGCGVYDEM